jgi:flagellar biogenesis protein FliO
MLGFISITTENINTMKSAMSELFSDLAPLFFIILGIVLIIFVVKSFFK